MKVNRRVGFSTGSLLVGYTGFAHASLIREGIRDEAAEIQSAFACACVAVTNGVPTASPAWLLPVAVIDKLNSPVHKTHGCRDLCLWGSIGFGNTRHVHEKGSCDSHACRPGSTVFYECKAWTKCCVKLQHGLCDRPCVLRNESCQ